MKLAKLLHNPGAGDEDHDRKDLVSLIESSGFKCRYSSTKKDDWKEVEKDVDFLVVAGGDGTVRQITKELLDRKLLDKTWPIGLLPLGTANNIAKTLQLEGETEELIECWHQWNIKKYDVGRITHLDDAFFFLESFGYGLFPYLMSEMKSRKKETQDLSPEESLQKALEVLLELLPAYKPHHCQLEIDGTDFSGQYLLVEVMNTRSIGPNLLLAPGAHPDDGELEVVLVSEGEQEQFASYLAHKLRGEEVDAAFPTVKAHKIKVSWEGTHVHVDDEVVKIKKGQEVEIEIKPGLLEFLVP
jgi:diacylglycerol kinase (ATP)